MERKTTLGARIGAMRREKGWTQLELAEKMAVTDKAVSKWERDLSWPDAASLPRLAALFGLTVDQLIGGEERPVGEEQPVGEESSLGRSFQGEQDLGTLFSLICKALTVALGAAAAALSALGELDSQSGFTLLGLGLACAGMALLKGEKK